MSASFQRKGLNKNVKRLASMVFSLVAILLSLLLLEGMLRLKNSSMKNYDMEMWKYSRQLKSPSMNPVLGHEHKRSRSAVLQGVEIRLNERGLRGGPMPERVESKRRVLFIGSSITMGWGVREEDIMSVRLKALFKKDGKDVDVLNSGIGNYNTLRYVENYLADLKDLTPTDIIVHYFLNDAEVLEAGGGNAILRNSQLAVTLWTAVHKQLVMLKKGRGTLLDHYQKIYEHDSHGYMDMKASLTKLKEHAEQNNIRLYLSIVPDVHDLMDYKFGFIHEEMRSISKELGYEFVDFLPAFEGLSREEIWNMPGDPHPNALGHEKMADVLYGALRNE